MAATEPRALASRAGAREVRVYADLAPRRYRAGMWAFALHRISGLAIALFLLLHIWEITSVTRGGAQGFDQTMARLAVRPFVIGEFLLFLAVVFHGINGVRLVLMDMGAGVRRQKALFWWVLGISAAVIVYGAFFFARRFAAYPWSL
ncbi:succinate dehydrogenase, cytochrome b556 subunit [Caldinitratiruptor microaerophilus]|uniref:succinate dehydrogenase, cytochrome b556 subunit n=1 Tax=Caldinitratiruptor microaerophilus TaxID=671077 RepID=UPI002231CD51|nr:succinate dehydrogenase, cytochrome b556 subunit [Caldinitratiruptor microaerophilus]